MKYYVQVGKGKSSYTNKYSFDNENQANWWFNCINTHSGYKKRLINSDGNILARVIT